MGRHERDKNGRSLNSFKTHGARMEIKGGSLLIAPVIDNTEGSYQCYAINSYGNTYSKTDVYVKEEVKPTVERIIDRKKTTGPILIIPTEKVQKGELGGDDPL